jgi:hypothetical protein
MSGVRGGEGDRESASSVDTESSDNSGSDILMGTGGNGVVMMWVGGEGEFSAMGVMVWVPTPTCTPTFDII